MQLLEDYNKIRYQIFKDFEAKNNIEYEFNTNGEVYHWGDYYAITIDDAITDLKSNAPVGEYESYIDFGVDNQKFRMNYSNWLKFGGSRNIKEIEELANKKHLDDLNQSKIAADKSEQIFRESLPEKPQSLWLQFVGYLLITLLVATICALGYVVSNIFIILGTLSLFWTLGIIIAIIFLLAIYEFYSTKYITGV